jgi:hypothetical protein
MKLILKIIFYLIIVVLATSIGVVIAVGPIFWSALLTGLILGIFMTFCFVGIWSLRMDFKHRFDSLKDRLRKDKLRFVLWLLCKLMGQKRPPASPPSRRRDDPGNQNDKVVYYDGHIGVA